LTREIQRFDYREMHIRMISLPGDTTLIFTGKTAEVINSRGAKVIKATIIAVPFYLKIYPLSVPGIKSAVMIFCFKSI
jgi:hypothetical protein